VGDELNGFSSLYVRDIFLSGSYGSFLKLICDRHIFEWELDKHYYM
jgi:hypothetical protein